MATTKDALTGDPLVSIHFSLELSGKAVGYFTEVGGIGSESEVVEHKIMTKGGTGDVRKVPGRLKWGDITLKRGITASMDIYDWRKQVENGKVDAARISGTITMLDQAMTPIAQWEFDKGWPSKISGPSLSAESNAIGVEEVTIVHEGIRRLK